MTSARTITPIVFWASCRPWPSAIAEADTDWAIRNPRLVGPGLAFLNAQRIPTMSRNASSPPTEGERSIGMTTFSTTACHWTVTEPASPAPTSPPMSACDDDDGRPKYQVMRFHVMAPARAAKTTTSACSPDGGSSTENTVLATLVPRKAPTKFMTAASSRATRGVRARVEIDVAIAFAASWKPLV